MLILGRKVGDTILIGDGIRLVVLASDKGGVRIGIEAPADVRILRGELLGQVETANRAATTATPAGYKSLRPQPGAAPVANQRRAIRPTTPAASGVPATPGAPANSAPSASSPASRTPK